jgi:hypothetical protein
MGSQEFSAPPRTSSRFGVVEKQGHSGFERTFVPDVGDDEVRLPAVHAKDKIVILGRHDML